MAWCFQQVKNGAPDYDNLYCSGNTIIMIFSGINMFIFSYLLYLHIRIHWSNTTFLKICLKVKTSILALIILYELLVFLRYTLVYHGNGAFLDSTLVLLQFIQSIVFFQICYFFVKKAAHFVEDNKKIRKIMRIMIFVAIAVFVGMMIWQIVDDTKSRSTRTGLCHTAYFILASVFN